MKSALLLTLIVSLAGSAMPLAAQEEVRTELSPLARSIVREASRLALDSMALGVEAVQQSGNPGDSNWSRVRGLAPGTDVVVTVRGRKPDRRRIVQADESTLTVLSRSTQVVEVLARGDVLEIWTEGRLSEKRQALGLVGGLGGAIGGAFVGAYVGGMVGGSDAENLGPMGVGMMAGVVGGAVLGYRAITHTKGDLIYRTP